MTWIQTVGEKEAAGPLKERYEAELNELGFVTDPVEAVTPVRPEQAEAERT